MEKETIKIEDMSYAQLDALEKLIKAQKKKVGGAFYKGETGVYEALFGEFGGKYEFPGCINVYGNAEAQKQLYDFYCSQEPERAKKIGIMEKYFRKEMMSYD